MRKGIILAGGSGTRLYPLTLSLSKQLLPVFDKPMIYYPLSTLMLAGITEILIITTPKDRIQFERLLGQGEQWGITIKYAEQVVPAGIAQAYLIAESFLDGAASVLILGDNIFFGHGLPEALQRATESKVSTIFGYHIADPRSYGVLSFDKYGNVFALEEKPEKPKSNYAVTGLYFLDNSAPERAKSLVPSRRGELEITDLLTKFINDGLLRHEILGRGYTWLDTGTHASLSDAGNFVRTVSERQGLQVGSPDEIAYRLGLISSEILKNNGMKLGKSGYGQYLSELAEKEYAKISTEK